MFIVAFLIRSNGILLPLSFCAILLSLYISKLLAHRFYKIPLLQPPLWAQVLPMVVFICGYSLMNVYLPNGGAGHPKMGLETLSVKSILGNVFYYGNIFQDFFPLLASVALALSAPFCCYGIYQNFYKHFGIMVFCASVFALNIIWPFTQGLRFVFVLLPFCVYYTLLGFHALLGKRETTSKATCDSKGFMPEEFTNQSLLANKDSSLQSTIRQICKISFILTLCIFIYYDLKEIIPNVRAKAQFPQDVYSKEALEMYHIIKEHTKENDIIAFFQPKILYLMTDRLALYQHQSCLEIESCALAFMQNVQYMLIREEEKYIYLLYQKHLHKVAQNATLGLYRVNFSYNATP